MAQKKKPAKKQTARKTSAKSKASAQKNTVHKGVPAGIFFLLGALIVALTYISGDALWGTLHTAVRGVFGIPLYFIGPMLVILSIQIVFSKNDNIAVAKIIETVFFILLLCAIFHTIIIGVPMPIDSGFGERLSSIYDESVKLSGGGVIGALIGWPVSALLGKVGGTIILVLVMIIFLMLVFHISFKDIVHIFSRPVKKGVVAIKEDRALNAQKQEERRVKRQERESRVDVAKYYGADTSKLAPGFSTSGIDHDPAKFINDEPAAKTTPKKAKTTTSKNEPVFPKKSPELEKSINEYEEIINSAAKRQQKTEAKKPAPKPAKPVKNDIYVESDGQTSLFGKEDQKGKYIPPSVELLKYSNSKVSESEYQNEIRERGNTLVETLRSFGVQTRIVGVHRGPSVTRYELQPAAGVKVSKITGLTDDIALNLAAEGIRIEAPIPGKAAVGIEIANKKRDSVSIRELIDSDEFRNSKGKLEFAVGKDIEGNIVMGDIAKMPHLLVAGTTGAGKSVFTNSIIMNILYKASPDEVKLILIDPKQVEFPIYNGIPHLLIPVVTEARKAAGALGWAVAEMMRRYKVFADNGVRDLEDYNEYQKDKEELEPIPQIVIVIDELADLMMAAPKEVEDSICRIAQLARAAGMHLIIATQSPRVDVVTGLIKANIPSRVALKVSNNVDSRVILDEGGADKLLGRGDLLYKPVGMGKPMRIQGSFIPTSEVRAVVNYLKNLSSAEYSDEIVEDIEKYTPQAKNDKNALPEETEHSNVDEKFEDAVKIIVETGQASTSFLQRKLSLGYARAARLMDDLEAMGIIGPAQGAKPREVLMSKEQWLERNVMKDEV
ncbi:MAG: DNA translocase FtsK [Ruminococcus sp.]|nr:DNA translocase FtsK [Ruminococcus sp.]